MPPYLLISVGRTIFTRYPEITMRTSRTNPAEIPPVAMFFAFIKHEWAREIIIIRKAGCESIWHIHAGRPETATAII
jgi:hypothetical protein